MDVSVIIVAAGNSTRMGEGVSKQLLEIGGKPVLLRTVQAFSALKEVREIVVSARRADFPSFEKVLSGEEKAVLAEGGATRQESVIRALEQLRCSDGLVAIHDGARPLIREQTIQKAFLEAEKSGAACVGVPVKDTLKQVDEAGRVVCTPDRRFLYCVQTPQVFWQALYRKAVQHAQEDGVDCTDDGQLVERLGHPVQMVEGDYSNLKITTPEDLPLAEQFLRRQRG